MISVIIPLYNKGPIIERSLRSVLSQDYDDFEVIVVNDGSTDHSADIVRSFNDPRIKLIEQENGGPSKARNTGIKHAKGEWIVFLDADDELLPGAIKHFIETASLHKEFNFYITPFYIQVGETKNLACQYSEGTLANPYKEHVLHTILPRTGAFMASSDLCKEYLFDERIRRFEDLEWLYRIYERADLFVSSKPVLINHQDYASASQARKDINEDFMGYLDFRYKSFWKFMALYSFYLGERDYYKEQVNKLYPSLRYRYDLLLLYKFIRRFV